MWMVETRRRIIGSQDFNLLNWSQEHNYYYSNYVSAYTSSTTSPSDYPTNFSQTCLLSHQQLLVFFQFFLSILILLAQCVLLTCSFTSTLSSSLLFSSNNQPSQQWNNNNIQFLQNPFEFPSKANLLKYQDHHQLLFLIVIVILLTSSVVFVPFNSTLIGHHRCVQWKEEAAEVGENNQDQIGFGLGFGKLSGLATSSGDTSIDIDTSEELKKSHLESSSATRSKDYFSDKTRKKGEESVTFPIIPKYLAPTLLLLSSSFDNQPFRIGRVGGGTGAVLIAHLFLT
ncbi:unnamed protein product [Orchesella dallaii]|uniref:Transmembrane protein n=1 Tax=Orchesella dallaii TaxID=48710 RepID=A0ABP1PNK7_9HEXA